MAIDTFLSQPDMTANTRRAYATTLRVIEREAGHESLDASMLAAIVTQHWGDASPATWNLRTAALRSFAAYAREQGGLRSSWG
jgi:peptide deformylase